MKITPETVKNLPLIEVHSHLDWPTAITITPESLMDLCDSERLTYTLLLGYDPLAQIEAIRKRKDRFGYLMWARPEDDRWFKGYEKILLDNRDVVKGIKIHPAFDGYTACMAVLDDLFASACKHDYVIATHTMAGKTSNAGFFRPVLEKYPQTKLILYHATPLDIALPILKEYPNVYMDISAGAFGCDVMLKALDVVGKEKILFGIDSPLGFTIADGQYQRHFRDVVEKEIALWVDFDEEILRHVLYLNAVKLFGLDKAAYGIM